MIDLQDDDTCCDHINQQLEISGIVVAVSVTLFIRKMMKCLANTSAT